MGIFQYENHVEALSPSLLATARQIDCTVEDSTPANNGLEVLLIDFGEEIELMPETNSYIETAVSGIEQSSDLSLVKFNDMLYAQHLVLSLATDVIARREPTSHWSWKTFKPSKHQTATLDPELSRRSIKSDPPTPTITEVSSDYFSNDLPRAKVTNSSPVDQNGRLYKETSKSHSTGTYSDLSTSTNGEGQPENSRDPSDGPKRFLPVPTNHKSSSSLGSRKGHRYSWKGEMYDLEEAIALAWKVALKTPLGHFDRAARLNDLGDKLGDRYLRTREISDLEKAVTGTRDVIQATPPNHRDRVTWLNNLRIALKFKHAQTGDLLDLEEATMIDREVFQGKPYEQFDRLG